QTAIAFAEALFPKKREVFRVTMRVPSERENVRECALAAALVAYDGNHIGIEWQFAVKPGVRAVGGSCLADAQAVNEACRVGTNFFQLRPDPADVDPVLGFVDYLAETSEGRVCLDPAVSVDWLGLLILELSQLVIDVMGVATLDAGLPVAKPRFVF